MKSAAGQGYLPQKQPSKVTQLADVLAWRESARAAGQTVVHCHGCFDVVHPGHIHHLQHARSLGDRLIVSVSADARVNKGINRPLIPDDLRASSLAALECVDVVYLNGFETAVELLNVLRPDIYVKGREYETGHDPRFVAEKNAVEANGGEVIFSSGDVVFSSTALIGALRDTAAFNSEKVRRYCRQHAVSAGRIESILKQVSRLKVVVVGDYIRDRYHVCEATGVAGESPMMALRSIGSTDYDGGAAIVARHAAALGAATTFFTALANDTDSADLLTRLADENITTLSTDGRRELVCKTRFMVDDQKLLKVDTGSAFPLDSRREEQTARRIAAATAAGDCDCVIFADFGYGLITPGLLNHLMPLIRPVVPIITADVSGNQASLLHFHSVDLLCPTEREMRETLGDFSSGIGAVVWKLLQLTQVPAALITLGKQGVLACQGPAKTPTASTASATSAGNDRLTTDYLPSLAGTAVDPLGAGDALLATASLCLAAGATLAEAAFIGSLAAAVEVQQIGNVPVTADDLLDAMLSLAIKDGEDLEKVATLSAA